MKKIHKNKKVCYNIVIREIKENYFIEGGYMSWNFSHGGPQQNFGWRTRNKGEWHYGRDYGTRGRRDVPLGVPKYCDGWVCHVLPNNKKDGLGNQVVLISPDGKEMVRFAHIASGTMNHLKTGQVLRTGDWIGDVGGVGVDEYSFDPHIHVEHGINPKYARSIAPGADDREFWLCGEQNKIEDYRDPNHGALPYSELEGLTDMAAKSRAAVLAGRSPSRRMAGVHPTVLANKKVKPSRLSSWFKTTWFGKLFYGGNDDKNFERSRMALNTGNATPTRQVSAPQQEVKDPKIATRDTSKQREEMKKAGFTDEAIDKFEAFVLAQKQRGGLTGVLGANAVRVNFDELYKGDKEMANVAKRYFAGGRGYEYMA